MTEPGYPPPVTWQAPAPQELPRLRDALIEQTEKPYEEMAQALMLSEGRGTVNPDPANPERAAALLLADERQRLTDARLYLVTADMTHVAQQAGAKLPSWEVRREDMPAASGLMVFANPIGEYRSDTMGVGKTVSIVAVSWGPTVLYHTEDTGVWLTFWSATDYELSVREAMGAHSPLGAMTEDEARAVVRDAQAPLSWDNEAVMTFGATEVRTVAGLYDPAEASISNETTLAWVQTTRAAWLLMRQEAKRPIAEVEEVAWPRPYRRRAERAGREAPPVRVVHLHHRHRPQRAGQPDAGGRTMGVRTVVTGHVRWQPYRSQGVIRPIWIEPHVRGPEDAPWSKHAATVHVLDRPPGR